MGGEFTMEDLDLSYSLIFSDYANRVMVDMADVKGTLYQVGDTTFIKAEVTGYDGVLYDVELWHCVPVPTKTVTVEIVADFENNIAMDGYYVLSGYNKENTLYISLAPFAEEIAGTFVNDGVFSRFGEGQYDFYASYTYVAKYIGVDEYGDPEYDVYSIEKGTMTVTVDEEENVVATATVICSNAVQYEITMTAKYDKPHLEYDAQYSVTKAYTADDIVTAEFDEDYGMVYWQVVAADGSDVCALYFFAEEADADIVVPVGEYTIDDSMDYSSVYASTGYDAYYGTVSPSLYATYWEDDPDYLKDMWFMVGGTVTVEKVDGKMKMTINAINSYDQEINITYDGTSSTGVENINVNVEGIRKQIVDGQLVIIRDGKAYNALGAQVK